MLRKRFFSFISVTFPDFEHVSYFSCFVDDTKEEEIQGGKSQQYGRKCDHSSVTVYQYE